MSQTLHVVVMGVSGCGKSTVAVGLRDSFGLSFAEGDDYHPEENVEKMRAGQPLTDDDRWPWLSAVADWTRRAREQGESTVLACSALKRSYRDVLRQADPETFFVHLHGDLEMLKSRMDAREHFMPLSLLQSQFDTLEMLGADEQGVLVDVTPPRDEVMRAAESAVRARLA